GLFLQAEDGIRDGHVTGVQSVLFRSVSRRDLLPQVAPGDSPAGSGDSLIAGDQPLQRPAEGARQDDHAHPDRPSGYFDAKHGPRSEERPVGKQSRPRSDLYPESKAI